MKRLWAVLNFAGIGLSVWTGYSEMTPDRLVHANPDIVFCGVALIGMIVFSLGSVWISMRRSDESWLRRPSWQRFFWSRDPLQHLFFTCCFFGSMAVGAAFRLRGASETGFWMFMFFLCAFFGLVLGQLGVYAIFREHIAPT
jgi:hypothetical protein